MKLRNVILSLVAFIVPLNAHADCTNYIEIASANWSASACVDDGGDELERQLSNVSSGEIDEYAEWCWYIREDLQFCDEIDENVVHSHPWCDSDPFPQYCDGLCCMMTIIDCGCGGCMSGTTEYCV